MMNYKIGQIIISKEDVIVEKALSEEKVIIPKGNRIIIGGDKLAHHLKDGMIQPLSSESTVEGYDANGLAKYIYFVMNNKFNLSEMFDEFDIEKDNFIDELEYALDDIGLG